MFRLYCSLGLFLWPLSDDISAPRPSDTGQNQGDTARSVDYFQTMIQGDWAHCWARVYDYSRGLTERTSVMLHLYHSFVFLIQLLLLDWSWGHASGSVISSWDPVVISQAHHISQVSISLAGDSTCVLFSGSVSCSTEGVFVCVLDVMSSGTPLFWIFKYGTPFVSANKGTTDGGNGGGPQSYW